MAKTPSTIIIIDDHDIVRKGLKELIEKMGSYKVVDEYNNGLAFVKNIPSLKTIPDLFILDYSMPLMSGTEVLKEALVINNNLKFLVLTQHFEETIINDVYKNGARGFLHKTCTAKQLKATIDNIVKIGYSNISEILKRVRYVAKPKSKPKIVLSEKELRLIELVCDEAEHTYQNIADIMNVSVKTVDKYRGQLFTKLNVKSKVGLVLYAFKNRLTESFTDPN